MAKPRPVIDQKAIDRMLKQGRGRGTHDQYKPWLTVRDVPSLGKSSRDKGWNLHYCTPSYWSGPKWSLISANSTHSSP